ncbi:MAG: septal ring lytic transglycosylase RlpA family protein [Alphaproteobacteria bacterium]|nr:septal ring lytic transglycosylase RlpA family protein [Alphaproteobacteria bacterium]
MMLCSFLSQNRLWAALAVLLVLGACSSRPITSPSRSVGTSGSAGGTYKVGQPYQVKGQWYYPSENYSYNETGIASWYGHPFHGKKTANGEIFNKHELTAAHKTLPMPSLARVTNLENGRSVVVRINDRGPFSGARIIDVSERCAQLLGFEKQGLAKVRVQVLADESKAIADAMRLYGGPTGTQVASAPVVVPPSVTIKNVIPVDRYVQLPVSGANQIYVQAGSFANPDNAESLASRLYSVGLANVTQANVRGTTYFRVRIGPLVSVAQADKILEETKKTGVPEARIIVD